MGGSSFGSRLDAFVAAHVETPVPEPRGLPRYVAPLPRWLENVGLRLVWLLVAINLVGTAFGFWYYLPQLSDTPVYVWPIVPVSPLATLYMALSLSAWRLGYRGRLVQLIHLLAFFGCLKYGAWSVFVQVFIEDSSDLPFLLWQFLIWSHAGMVTQAFLIHRYAEFPLWAVGVTTAWFVTNDLFDFFISAFGGPHHTWLNVFWDNGFDRSIPQYEYMAAGGVATTVLAIVFALATWMALRNANRE